MFLRFGISRAGYAHSAVGFGISRAGYTHSGGGGWGTRKMTSFPRKARVFGAPRGRRVGMGLEQRSNTTDMMASRWKVFYFTHSIPEEEQKDIAPCPHCFSKLVLMGEIS